uniref:Aldo_ket_red domain-containing protein n=1 Tax=Rhabditophanes sp. KR3021 TaxID=114890 RepID=A0AC35U733_9BILA
MASKTATLNDGNKIPLLGLGTWLSKPGEVKEAVKHALNIGYRHIDCARLYQNENEVGQALEEVFAEGKIKREDVFITTKIWNSYHSKGEAAKCLALSLQELRLQYVDLLLIHWPMGYQEGGTPFPFDASGKKMLYSDVDYTETWQALEEFQAAGKAKSIGVSNFEPHQIERILKIAKVVPAINQVECNIFFQQKALREFCEKHNILVQAYSPLTNPTNPLRKEGDKNILQDEGIIEIASKYGKTPAQIALAFLIHEGIPVIPKSVTATRIEENMNVDNVVFSPEEIQSIRDMDCNFRLVCIKHRDGDHPHFPW